MFVQNYAEKKDQGLAEVLTKDKAHILVSKRFDPETGAELDPLVTTLNRDDLEKQRDQFQAQADSVNALLDDMDKAVI